MVKMGQGARWYMVFDWRFSSSPLKDRLYQCSRKRDWLAIRRWSTASWESPESPNICRQKRPPVAPVGLLGKIVVETDGKMAAEHGEIL